jgi:magnesium-protoporphyrin IX monomethyl ester (oxidative) cyclase
VRREWDELIEEMRSDPNKLHFQRNADFDFDLEGAFPRTCGRSSLSSW